MKEGTEEMMMTGIENTRKIKNTSPIMETVMVGKKEKAIPIKMEASLEMVIKERAIKEEINPVENLSNKKPRICGVFAIVI
jgi:hypothetical protein